MENTLLSPASAWIRRWSHLLTPACSVLDVACGSGRHLHWFAARGHAVTGLDLDVRAAAQSGIAAELICADLEQAPWPLAGSAEIRQFGAVIVTNYLWRPLFTHLLHSLQPGGVLLYETFAEGHAAYGRPTRPDFLLQPGELLRMCAELHVVAYESGLDSAPERVIQRIAAIRPPVPAPVRLALCDGAMRAAPQPPPGLLVRMAV